MLIAEDYQKLIWFLFPSEVLRELLELKYQSNLTFDNLVSFNNLQSQGKEAWTTPFTPRDYNKGRFKMEFS